MRPSHPNADWAARSGKAGPIHWVGPLGHDPSAGNDSLQGVGLAVLAHVLLPPFQNDTHNSPASKQIFKHFGVAVRGDPQRRRPCANEASRSLGTVFITMRSFGLRQRGIAPAVRTCGALTRLRDGMSGCVLRNAPSLVSLCIKLVSRVSSTRSSQRGHPLGSIFGRA